MSNLEIVVDKVNEVIKRFSEELKITNSYLHNLVLYRFVDPVDLDIITARFKDEMTTLLDGQLKYMQKVSHFIRKAERDKFTPKYAGEIAVPPLFPSIPKGH